MTADRRRAHRAPRPRKRVDRRKALAAVAALSVLGVGAGITTLAAWQQSDSVSGTVSASTLCVRESVDNGLTWIDGSLGSTATFSVTPASLTASPLSPNDKVFAFVQFALCSSPLSRGATLSLTSATLPSTTGTLSAGLTYALGTATTAANCTSSTFSSPLIPLGNFNTTPPTTTITTLPASGTTFTGGGTTLFPAQGVCLELAASSVLPSTAMNTSATPTWLFSVQSQ